MACIHLVVLEEGCPHCHRNAMAIRYVCSPASVLRCGISKQETLQLSRVTKRQKSI